MTTETDVTRSLCRMSWFLSNAMRLHFVEKQATNGKEMRWLRQNLENLLEETTSLLAAVKTEEGKA